MGFAPTWLRQVSPPPASQNHFNHCLGQDRSETKNNRSWSWEVLCCVVKHNLVTLVVIMILEDTATFYVLFIVFFSILCLEHHHCGDQQWRSLRPI